MYYSMVICDDALYQEAKEFFLQQWRSDLLSRTPSGLVWAYLVTQQMYKLWKTNFSFINWVHVFEDVYFSASHSKDLLVLAVDTKKVAVDIEYINTRDESLLKNVHMPDSPYSPRENFYLQRCAKECLVKYLDSTSSQMDEMTVTAFMPNHYFAVDGWEFNSLIIMNYRWREHPVHLNIKEWIVTAFLRQDDYLFMNV